jgi:hypothetical protein
MSIGKGEADMRQSGYSQRARSSVGTWPFGTSGHPTEDADSVIGAEAPE